MSEMRDKYPWFNDISFFCALTRLQHVQFHPQQLPTPTFSTPPLPNSFTPVLLPSQLAMVSV